MDCLQSTWKVNSLPGGNWKPPSPEKEGSHNQRRNAEENGDVWEGYSEPLRATTPGMYIPGVFFYSHSRK